MECDICRRPFTSGNKPTCASCVQATLYAPRVEQAAALLGREKAHTHAEAVVRPGNDGILAALPEDADWEAIQVGVRAHRQERDQMTKQIVDSKVKDITDKAEQLKLQIEQHRAYIAGAREGHERRHRDLAQKVETLRRDHEVAMQGVDASARKTKSRLRRAHDRTVEARTVICKATGSLSLLRKVKMKDAKSIFWLAGLPIPDLRDLNGGNGRLRLDYPADISAGKGFVEPHEIITASLDNVCQLLGLICHNLSVRLPAEILLPINGSMHAAILPMDSSYKFPILPTTSYSSASSSPEVSRLLQQKSELSRPRPLTIDRPFPQLQREDPKAAAFFREGVVLLAYDIAWLCRSQGVDIKSTFEDICELGRNLYELIPRSDNRRRPPLNRNATAATTKTEATDTSTPETPVTFGSLSHNSARYSLAGPYGNALFGSTSDWNISIHKLTDQLKTYLRREAQRAEWDIIEQNEWDEELEDERPVFVGGARRVHESKGPAMSVMTVKPSDDEALPHSPDVVRGQSGWTKVRGRPGDS